MVIKAIAVDVDGTLTNDDKEIAPRTREVLIDAQRAGIRVIIASGRPSQGVKRLAEQLELAQHGGLIASYNGGHVKDVKTGEILYEHALPKDIIKPLLDHVRQFDVIPWFTRDGYLYVEHAFVDDIYIRGKACNIIKHECEVCDLLVCEVRSLENLADIPQCKLLTAGTDTYMAEHWKELAAPFEGVLDSTFTSDFFYEFMPKGVNKGSALANVLPTLGIDASETVTFGDAQNDVEMLRWAGTGVAMGNATDEVKAAADVVTLTNNEDGIAAALEKLLG